jgi:hypothetical protein
MSCGLGIYRQYDCNMKIHMSILPLSPSLSLSLSRCHYLF